MPQTSAVLQKRQFFSDTADAPFPLFFTKSTPPVGTSLRPSSAPPRAHTLLHALLRAQPAVDHPDDPIPAKPSACAAAASLLSTSLPSRERVHVRINVLATLSTY
ncbi:hypothetical protein AURDEDRAFT_155150 [Auricularia subglabra TFB-10046 SS5]|nr:hypothetical protein AURDEDRAFT_155150 [Auricularia subglabra TFB-10046 SS5]